MRPRAPPTSCAPSWARGRAGLLPILPELSDRVPGIAAPPPTAPEIERLRTLEAAAALLQAAGEAAPVCSCSTTCTGPRTSHCCSCSHVLRADARMRVLVVATYRDSEPSRSPLLPEVVTGLARRHDVSRLELAPLTEHDVAAILGDAGRSSSLAPRVRAVTQGNPFFVGEVMRSLGEGDTLEQAITPRVRDVVRARLARLPAGTAEILAAAAVTGHEFDADIVATASGRLRTHLRRARGG